MKYRRSKQFQKSFDKLPSEIQEKARKAFSLFKQQPYYPFHPSLVIKKIEGTERIWEGRIDYFHRFTFEILEENGETVYFSEYWTPRHNCNKAIGRSFFPKGLQPDR